MNCLYYCTTPFQIIVALDIHVNGSFRKSETDHSTIVIVDIFKDSKVIAERLSDEHIFDEVFVVKEEAHKSKKGACAKYTQIAKDTLLPKTLIRYQFGQNAKDIINRKYDVIISSVFCHPVAALLTINPESDFVMMDDGLASYYGDWTSRIRSKSYLRLLRVRNKGRDISKPSSLYVMRKELCKSTVAKTIIQLPAIDDQLLKIARRVFGVDESASIYKERIILLSQPNMDETTKNVFEKVLDFLEDDREDVIVRTHPRERNFSLYQSFSVDHAGIMWELLVDTDSIEEKLLITSYSTAVFTPKLLYDREPWIVFLYKMIKSDPNITTLVGQLRDSYRHKERICEAESREELEDFISRLRRTAAALEE